MLLAAASGLLIQFSSVRCASRNMHGSKHGFIQQVGGFSIQQLGLLQLNVGLYLAIQTNVVNLADCLNTKDSFMMIQHFLADVLSIICFDLYAVPKCFAILMRQP